MKHRDTSICSGFCRIVNFSFIKIPDLEQYAIGDKMEPGPRLARHRRQNLSSSSTSSALSRTSDQSSAVSISQRILRSSSSNNTTLGISSASNENYSSGDSSTFIQQNPRYSSLWLQKCLLPKRLDASSLNATTRNGLNPNCYPYPNMADSVGKFYPSIFLRDSQSSENTIISLLNCPIY